MKQLLHGSLGNIYAALACSRTDDVQAPVSILSYFPLPTVEGLDRIHTI